MYNTEQGKLLPLLPLSFLYIIPTELLGKNPRISPPSSSKYIVVVEKGSYDYTDPLSPSY